MTIAENLKNILKTLPTEVTLVAVSKTKPNAAVLEAYQTGFRIFGENKVQELCAKYESLPKDIEWHMIGHLQTNKVKYIAPFVSLIHGIDSLKLLKEVNKQGKKSNRKIPVLLQFHIAEEATKFGLDATELEEIITSFQAGNLPNVEIKGMMGMATFTEDETKVKREFDALKVIFDIVKQKNTFGSDFTILSMGMSGDYQIAIESGSNMIRVGSAIFGERV